MPLDDKTIGSAASDVNFIARVTGALAKACPAIQFESASAPNHAVRLALVGRVLQQPNAYAVRFAPFVACNWAIIAHSLLSDATDTEIENAVNGLIDMWALQGV